MEANKETICPWCQTEIVWDPEIGPEETCPHCWNELGDYRSVNLSIQTTGGEEPEDEQDDELDDEVNDDADLDADDALWEESAEDRYGETVQQCLDEQEEAPECMSCHEFMLLAGKQTTEPAAFLASQPVTLGKPFLKAPFTVNVYVCPSCFRVDHILDDRDRLAMIERIGQQA